MSVGAAALAGGSTGERYWWCPGFDLNQNAFLNFVTICHPEVEFSIYPSPGFFLFISTSLNILVFLLAFYYKQQEKTRQWLQHFTWSLSSLASSSTSLSLQARRLSFCYDIKDLPLIHIIVFPHFTLRPHSPATSMFSFLLSDQLNLGFFLNCTSKIFPDFIYWPVR